MLKESKRKSMMLKINEPQSFLSACFSLSTSHPILLAPPPPREGRVPLPRVLCSRLE